MFDLALIGLVGAPALLLGLLLGALIARRRSRPARPSGPIAAPRGAAAGTPTRDAKGATHRREVSPFEAGLANVINLLNNRLSAIMGFAALVNREQLSPQDQEALDVVRAEARQAADVVRDLIHLVQEPGPATDAAPLAASLEDALRRDQGELSEHRVRVAVEVDPAVTLVAGRQAELVNLFGRLLKFAVERLRDAVEPRKITWSARALGGAVVVTQIDTGGIVAPELLHTELDPYHQSDRRVPGYGELALARRVAENLGGSLRLDAGAAGGAHVTVTLLPGTTAEEPLLHAKPGASPIARGRILVVEDDPVNQRALAQLLEKEGHHVTIASNGIEAFQHIERAAFDAIVTDLQMPLLGGRGLYEQTLEQFPQVARRFVFVTGDDVRAASHDFLAHVPQPTVRKPYDIAEMLVAIYEVARRPTPSGRPSAGGP